MLPVNREEILDYQSYNDSRDRIRGEALAAKAPRRIHVGNVLTFLFENRTTVRYQVQEMMRAEQIVREKEIQHELDTYNELLGGDGELGCSLLIEIETEAERAEKLTAWLPLIGHLYVRLENGEKIRPKYDKRQVGDTRLSSVQYLKFDTGGAVPVAIGSDFELFDYETVLTPEQRNALGEDLRG